MNIEDIALRKTHLQPVDRLLAETHHNLDSHCDSNWRRNREVNRNLNAGLRFGLTLALLASSLSVSALNLPAAQAKNAAAAKNAAGAGVAQSSARALPLGSKVAVHGFRDRLFKGKLSADVTAAEKLLLSGKYPEAQDAFRQAINKNSKDATAITGMGLALALQFKLDAADEKFTQALKVNPKTPLAYVGQGMVKLYRLQTSNMTVLQQRQAALNSAEASCRTALRLDPNAAEAYIVLGQIQKEQGRLPEAKASLSKAITLDPQYGTAFVQRGLIELKTGETAAALTDFSDAIALKSSNAGAHYGLGLAYLAQGQLDDAQKSLNTSISLNRNSAPAHIAMGDVYRLQGNRVAAVNEYQKAISIKAESEDAYLRMSDIREGRGDLELALADVRSGLALSPNNVDLHRRAAEVSLRLEKTDDALKEYSIVLQISPGDAKAVKGMTRALVIKAQKDADGAFFLNNNYESAEGLIKQAIAMNPNDMELRLADAKLRAMSGKPVDLSTIGTPTNDAERIAYAEAALAQFKYQEATQAMQTVISNCTSAEQVFSVADMALMIRDLDSAEAAYKRGGTFDNEDALARSRRGLAQVDQARDKARQEMTMAKDLASKKQYPSAIDKYRNAAYLNPRQAEANLGLAATLEKLWKNKAPAMREAALHYRAYVSLMPNMPEKQAEKIAKKADKCDEIAYKIEQGKPPSKLSAVFAPFGTFATKVESGFKDLVK